MTRTALRPMRWSTVRDCPRRACYEAEGAPARDLYDRERRVLFRGKTLGRDYADMLATQHGEDAIERERKVAWPLGIGHIDVYVKETATAVEVLSSAHASDQMIHSKLLQLVGYVEHDPDAENGMLVILNPSDYSEERVFVSTASAAYRELVAEMHERIAAVARWRDEGTLPDRVCRKPSDAYGHFCRHADHCFHGWQPPDVPAVDDPDVRRLVVARLGLKREEDAARAVLTEKETLRKAIDAELADALEAGEHRAGGAVVRVTHVKARESFNLKRARLGGVWTDALEEYVDLVGGHVRVSVEKVSDEPVMSVDDFGDEAPW